jgi:DNA-binding HxlR family transcriptional regulator
LRSTDKGIPREASGGRPAGHRAGSTALALLMPPLTLPVLRALEAGPMRLAELRKVVGLPPQTTLRGHLGNLVDQGAIVKRVRPAARASMDYELAPMGWGLLEVADSVETWLSLGPDGPLEVSSGAGRGVIRALVDGWDSRMVHGLTAQSLSLTEIDMLIPDLNYPALERRLAAMRLANIVEFEGMAGARTLYRVTDWGRRAIAPLARAIRCERIHHLPDPCAAPTHVDIEVLFLLALPLAEFPRNAAGWCQFQVEDRSGNGVAGVRVDIESGQILSCVSRLDPQPRHWAAGSAERWFVAAERGDPGQLRFGGGGKALGQSLVQSLHAVFTSNGGDRLDHEAGASSARNEALYESDAREDPISS